MGTSKKLDTAAADGQVWCGRTGYKRLRKRAWAVASADSADVVVAPLCVFKAAPGISLGLSFHAARERATLTRVDPEGAAAGSGLEPGDVILEIDGQPVTSALAAASMLRGLEGSIELEVLRPAKRTAGQGFVSTPAAARAQRTQMR